MNITEILHYLDANGFDIWEYNGDLFIAHYHEQQLPADLKQIVKTNKSALVLRQVNNQFAKEKGWVVANFGEVYYYRYSFSGFIFIERHSNEMVDIYRCSLGFNEKAYNSKNIGTNISFSQAYSKAAFFLDWYNTKQSKSKSF